MSHPPSPAAFASNLVDTLSWPLDAPFPVSDAAVAGTDAPARPSRMAGFGLPHDRHTWTAARRSRAALQAHAQRAARQLDRPQSALWQDKLGRVLDGCDLARLAAPLDAALAAGGRALERHRRDWRTAVDATFRSTPEPWGRWQPRP